ncbi:TetR/AcrR family transcriptional regulator [Isoptericola aurantiacus]|uniref:TetR/AcrR family transcriptional regulator n=1 Tax=Isoptericola aurantiacus TaxID=3377839 RepID=UPI00383A0D19
MAGSRRTRLSPDERRQQLLALGVGALADHRLEDVTIEDLAARAGVSPGLVHYYFGNRQGLHSAIVRTARDAMLHATEPRADLPPRARLRDTLDRFVEFVRDHDATFYSLVRGAASGDENVRTTIQEARDVLAGHLRDVFAEIGVEPEPLLDVALHSWISFAEQALVDAADAPDVPAAELAGFLERSALGVAAALDPDAFPAS